MNIVATINVASMTSLQLVDFINTHRKQQAEAAGADFPSEGFAALQHKHFLAKVPAVLGEETSAEFLADLLDSYGRPRAAYRFPKREACLMAMSYSYELQAAVYDYMTELEAQLAAPKFVIPQNLPDALRLAADLAEENARVTQERDIAVKTKALIGSKREATAMATASAASKKARQLEQELGRGALHATIIAVEKAAGIKLGKQGFRPLQRWCKAHGVTPRKVPCPRYGEAASWPARAWSDCYDVSLVELFGEVAA